MSDESTRATYELMWRSFRRERKTQLLDSPFRIYGMADASLWAAVDEEDYHYFSQWLWSYSRSPTGKIYIKRNSGHGAIEQRIDGKLKQVGWIRGKQKSIYLHREILIRSGKVPPSPAHKICDHEDGNELNCQRYNLDWATIGQNNRNKYGLAQLERMMADFKLT